MCQCQHWRVSLRAQHTWETMGINYEVVLHNPSNAEATFNRTIRTQNFRKTSKPCHVGTHWKALAEYSHMSTHLWGFQSFFCFFLYNFVLAKLATCSIRVNKQGDLVEGSWCKSQIPPPYVWPAATLYHPSRPSLSPLAARTSGKLAPGPCQLRTDRQ